MSGANTAADDKIAAYSRISAMGMGMGMGAKRMFMIAMFLVVVGGLNWGVQAATGKDLVSRLVGKRAWIVYGLVGIAALFIGFARDTYLPFLGETVMPCSLLSDQTPEGADTEVQVHVKPGAKVMFWATEPSTDDLKEVQDWRHAYLGYKNAGVTTADGNGIAVLRVRKPQAYTVGAFNQKELSPHVHYRVCKSAGMLDRVETVFVEAFANQNQREAAGSAEEERKLGMAGLQAKAASLEHFENPEGEDELVEDGIEETQDDSAEGFEDDDEQDEEGFMNLEDGEEEQDEEGFMNQYVKPVKSTETFIAEDSEANFAPDYILPKSIRNRTEDMPLYAIAEETEQNRIVEIDGFDESVKHAGSELSQAY